MYIRRISYLLKRDARGKNGVKISLHQHAMIESRCIVEHVTRASSGALTTARYRAYLVSTLASALKMNSNVS